MGYRGKVDEQAKARVLRAHAWTLQDIADELGVAKSSVSTWVRDVDFEPSPRRASRRREPNALQRRKADEIAAMDAWGVERLGVLGDQAFLAAGAALYAGEGAKRDGKVIFVNCDPLLVEMHVAWLRRFFDIDEGRLRARLHLHDSGDVRVATDFWSKVTGVPIEQFIAPCIVPSPSETALRGNRHEFGCCTVRYSCSRTHRAVMGLVRALLSSPDLPG